MIELRSVHDALQAAVIATSSQPSKPDPKVNMTVRLDADRKRLLKEICETNGTTASDFLRACADALISDYLGKK
jgi:hypothetical protein